MPTYEYRCTECGEQLEVVQSFSDDPLTVCPACKGKLRKLFSPVGVVFKGSGFYKTDSRSGKSKTSSGTSSNGSDASSGTSDSGSSSTGSDSKSDTKTSTPATATPSTSSGGSDSTGGGSKVA
jgi:putative FmdB family regulatory protein